MKFYQRIVPYYSSIFPLNPDQVSFVLEHQKVNKEGVLLDVGCALGELAQHLANHFTKIEAIDLDDEMIKMARQSNSKPFVDYRTVDMLSIGSQFKPKHFDIISCFGNTLVHLSNPLQVFDFFSQVEALLKTGGNFLFQIINYDRILEQEISSLPTIENHKIRFERHYRYIESSGTIEFKTHLLVKIGNKNIRNKVLLYPLRKQEVKQMLEENGFENVKFYGDFKKAKLTKNSVSLVVSATL